MIKVTYEDIQQAIDNIGQSIFQIEDNIQSLENWQCPECMERIGDFSNYSAYSNFLESGICEECQTAINEDGEQLL